jgi:hypothetical protein
MLPSNLLTSHKRRRRGCRATSTRSWHNLARLPVGLVCIQRRGRRTCRKASCSQARRTSSPTITTEAEGSGPSRRARQSSYDKSGNSRECAYSARPQAERSFVVGHMPDHIANGAKTHCADFCVGGNRFDQRYLREPRERFSGSKCPQVAENIDWRRRSPPYLPLPSSDTWM